MIQTLNIVSLVGGVSATTTTGYTEVDEVMMDDQLCSKVPFFFCV